MNPKAAKQAIVTLLKDRDFVVVYTYGERSAPPNFLTCRARLNEIIEGKETITIIIDDGEHDGGPTSIVKISNVRIRPLLTTIELTQTTANRIGYYSIRPVQTGETDYNFWKMVTEGMKGQGK